MDRDIKLLIVFIIVLIGMAGFLCYIAYEGNKTVIETCTPVCNINNGNIMEYGMFQSVCVINDTFIYDLTTLKDEDNNIKCYLKGTKQ